MLKKLNKVAVIILAFVITVCSICANPTTAESPAITNVPTVTVQKHSNIIKAELVRQVDDYISQSFPKSKLTGTSIVKHCLTHDFDICFALAQAEIESGFGTVGKAKRTNSPWNVGAWDGRSAQVMNKLGYGYSHPDLSIEPYIELVKTKYLGETRTVHDLMKNYVTISGKRYASDRGYEAQLKSTYKKICTKTKIRHLQDSLKRTI
jgi:hypothetical protein